MKQTLIALVVKGNGSDFFIKNPPIKPPEEWIKHFVDDVTDVESVEVFELGKLHAIWMNPNCCPES
jgi:hypothetical protein